MGRIFNMDGPLFRNLTKMADAFLLTLLFWLSTVTVIGFGLGLTAAFTVVFKQLDECDHGVLRDFFQAVKKNFRQGIIIWLILAVVGLVLFWDWQILPLVLTSGQVLTGGRYIILVIVLLWIMVVLYVFPLLARFDNSVSQTMKNALLLSIRYFPYTVLLLFFSVLPVTLIVLVPQSTGFVLFLVLILWPGTWIMITAGAMKKLFQPFMPEEEKKEDEF
ncbi:MAG: DUF624 domain-containing protein [Lachnospiraceae bacterium]|nr:DUF624 domain-containing protein [Lachnospiraceae bacterium]MDY5742897.1 DUF624 domain-containing protein [Lachnospiraceae bacterium]